jgi:hypothetical protein
VHRKPRIKLPLTEEAPLSTTKSDGMWKNPVRYRCVKHYQLWLLGEEAEIKQERFF